LHQQKYGSHDMKQTDSSIIIVRNVCVLTSESMIVYLSIHNFLKNDCLKSKLLLDLKNYCQANYYTIFMKFAALKAEINSFFVLKYSLLKVILHQFWVKKFSPWKFKLEYASTFTKLFMHVSRKLCIDMKYILYRELF
jgi:hypothetical protein